MASSPKGADASPSAEMASLSLNQPGSAPSSGDFDEEVVGQNGDATTEEPSATTLTLRALVSTKEAGVIIGKGGANVADLREKSGVKAGVSKVIQGVHDRVLTVSGSLEGVAKVRNANPRAMKRDVTHFLNDRPFRWLRLQS